MFLLIRLALLPILACAIYSVHYASNNQRNLVDNQVGVFQNAPEAEHIADIYTRLSGMAPLLKGFCYFHSLLISGFQ